MIVQTAESNYRYQHGLYTERCYLGERREKVRGQMVNASMCTEVLMVT